jgi:hypothetical protein
LEKAPLGGPVTVRVGGDRQHAISLELARMVIVLPSDSIDTVELATA